MMISLYVCKKMSDTHINTHICTSFLIYVIINCPINMGFWSAKTHTHLEFPDGCVDVGTGSL